MRNGANFFTAEKVAELRKSIDFSDIPEITDFSGGRLRNYTPKKKNITCKIDIDVLDWLKKGGKGYQTRLNQILREAMDLSSRAI